MGKDSHQPCSSVTRARLRDNCFFSGPSVTGVSAPLFPDDDASDWLTGLQGLGGGRGKVTEKRDEATG